MQISQAVVEKMKKHALCDLPIECCGLLIGNSKIIEQAVPAENILASESRYLVNPSDHFEALRVARSKGLSVIGAYHSHPKGPTVPSSVDLLEASYEEFLYVIVFPGVDEGSTQVNGFRIIDEVASPVLLSLVF
jgi:proteasome lid subunit RPN8/RPN11